MTFVLTFIFLGFCVLIVVYGSQKPILYLINTIVVLLIATAQFTSPGNDWVNNLWGCIMLALAMYWGNLYLKLKH